jgi:signal transduction histidine kinase
MKRILVIDDDPSVRGLIVETIRFKGWDAIDAADGETGLKIAAQELPDLILCDIQMPRMDGYAVLHAIRGNKTTAAIPFIFLSGLGEKPKVRQGMESGADDYIIKPFTIQELTGAINARFEKLAAFHETAETRLKELRESITFALPHELVTPLNTILGFSSLLVETPEISREELKEYASLMHQSAERLKELVEKFLLFAQVELTARDSETHDTSFLVPHITKETIAAAANRVAGEFQRPGDLELSLKPIQHRISPSHLERVVRELVQNAFKFSTPKSKVEVRSARTDGKFQVEVLDHGRGLSPEQIQRVGANIQFDRRLQEQQGSGLGLAISRRLVELYGGKLHLQSTPGEYTSARIEFPI